MPPPVEALPDDLAKAGRLFKVNTTGTAVMLPLMKALRVSRCEEVFFSESSPFLSDMLFTSTIDKLSARLGFYPTHLRGHAPCPI